MTTTRKSVLKVRMDLLIPVDLTDPGSVLSCSTAADHVKNKAIDCGFRVKLETTFANVDWPKLVAEPEGKN